MNGTQMPVQSLREIGEPAYIDAANEIDTLAARLAEAERLLRKAPPGSELVELVRRGK